MSVKKFESFELAVGAIRKDMQKAAAQTLNKTAYEARQSAVGNVKKNFTTRNQFTEKSITFQKCPLNSTIPQMKSSAGVETRAGYMARQEEGGLHTPNKGAKHLHIPTALVRKGKSQAGAIRKNLLFSNLNTMKPLATGRSFRARLVRFAYVANKTKQKIIYRTKKLYGVFEIKNFKKSKENGIKFKMDLLYNISHDTTTTKPAPWLEPAAHKAAAQMQTHFNDFMSKA